MGGIRYKEEDSDGYINASAKYLVPPIESQVRAAIKDWRKTATELQIPIKLLESYSIRWDEL